MLLTGFKKIGLVGYRKFNITDAKEWFPISILLVLMIYTATKSLQYLSIGIFTVFKNLTIILVAIFERKIFGIRLSWLKWASFITIVGSSVIGGFADLNFNWKGYCWMIINCLSSAMYGLGMRLVIKKVQFKDFDSVYFNNVLALPIIFIASIVLEDWKGFFTPL